MNSEWRQYGAANPNYVTPRLRTLAPMELDGKPIPDRRWIVPGWIPHGQVTMLSGDGGLGKSTIAMQLMTGTATGAHWLGVDVEPVKVLGVFCEDAADELHRRQTAINRHYGTGFADLENVLWSPRVGHDNALMTFPVGFQVDDYGNPKGPAPTEFFQQIHNEASDFGAQLVVLDSLHDLFSGNENSRPHAHAFMNHLRSLALDIDGAVVLCCHPSLSGRNTGTGEAGSTAWRNACRSHLYFYRDPEATRGDGVTILERKKSNYAAAGDQIHTTWQDGVFVAEERSGGMVGTLERRNVETLFLECLDALREQGRNVSASERAGGYAPRLMAKMPDSGRLKVRDFERAMESLFAQGRIHNVAYGPPSKGAKRIERNPNLERKENADD